MPRRVPSTPRSIPSGSTVREQSGRRAAAIKTAYERLKAEDPTVEKRFIVGVESPYEKGGKHGHYVSAFAGRMSDGQVIEDEEVRAKFLKYIEEALEAEHPNEEGMCTNACSTLGGYSGPKGETRVWIDPEDGSMHTDQRATFFTTSYSINSVVTEETANKLHPYLDPAVIRQLIREADEMSEDRPFKMNSSNPTATLQKLARHLFGGPAGSSQNHSGA